MAGFLDMPGNTGNGTAHGPLLALAQRTVESLTDSDLVAAVDALRLLEARPRLANALALIFQLEADEGRALIARLRARARGVG